jgi:hypothetical protein
MSFEEYLLQHPKQHDACIETWLDCPFQMKRESNAIDMVEQK